MLKSKKAYYHVYVATQQRGYDLDWRKLPSRLPFGEIVSGLGRLRLDLCHELCRASISAAPQTRYPLPQTFILFHAHTLSSGKFCVPFVPALQTVSEYSPSLSPRSPQSLNAFRICVHHQPDFLVNVF